MCKTSHVSLMSSYNELVTTSGFYFFSAYLKTKLQTVKAFKIKCGNITMEDFNSLKALG